MLGLKPVKGFDYLERFVKREKHARVPFPHIEDGFKLGSWVSRQRSSYKKNSLSPAPIRALEAVKGWVWDPHAASWQEGFDYLERFVKREKHARVPREYIEDGFKLGHWVSRQRSSYKKNSLSPAPIRALESVKGWIWNSFEADWQEEFDYLERFVKREKHARVPINHIEAGFNLGTWVSNQRSSNRKKSLSPARIRALEAVKGWVWDPYAASWQKGFDYLKRFVKRERHAQVPINHIEAGFKLGMWVRRQRSSYRKKSLSPARIRALGAVKEWFRDAR